MKLRELNWQIIYVACTSTTIFVYFMNCYEEMFIIIKLLLPINMRGRISSHLSNFERSIHEMFAYLMQRTNIVQIIFSRKTIQDNG